MIHTSRYSTAARRRVWGNYTDPESGWSRTTKGWSYGRKCHVAMDVDSPIVLEWIVTEGNLHDAKVSHDLIDAVRNLSYIPADSAYDTSGIYDYIFENTHCIPVIDTNKRSGIRPERLTVHRRIGIDLRRVIWIHFLQTVFQVHSSNSTCLYLPVSFSNHFFLKFSFNIADSNSSGVI